MAFGEKTAYGKRYLSYFGYIRLNIDVPDNLSGKVALKKGEETIAVIAEDVDGNLKAKVLNPFDLYASSFVMLDKPASCGNGQGHFDYLDSVPGFDEAMRLRTQADELERIDDGFYDELMLAEVHSGIH